MGKLIRIDGIMKASTYCEILDEGLLGSLQKLGIPRAKAIFQQDNDLKHTARLTAAWLKDNDINVMSWPPSSPDMNIIEHVWHYLEVRVNSRTTRLSNLEELWVALQEEWENIDIEYIHNLYLSIPRRLQALRDAKGGHTKY